MTQFNEIIRKWTKTIIITAIIAMIATIIIVPRMSKEQSASVDITIPVPVRPATENYEYDGYYALQAADLFTSTLVSWFRSPDFVARIYAKANVPLVVGSMRKMEKIFLVKKVSGQFVTVSYSASNEKQAIDLGSAISDSLKERVEQMNNQGSSSLRFSVLVGKPLVVLEQRNKFIDALIVGIIVLVFGLNIVIIADALKIKR
jgi:hypothetical protein